MRFHHLDNGNLAIGRNLFGSIRFGFLPALGYRQFNDFCTGKPCSTGGLSWTRDYTPYGKGLKTPGNGPSTFRWDTGNLPDVFCDSVFTAVWAGTAELSGALYEFGDATKSTIAAVQDSGTNWRLTVTMASGAVTLDLPGGTGPDIPTVHIASVSGTTISAWTMISGVPNSASASTASTLANPGGQTIYVNENFTKVVDVLATCSCFYVLNRAISQQEAFLLLRNPLLPFLSTPGRFGISAAVAPVLFASQQVAMIS